MKMKYMWILFAVAFFIIVPFHVYQVIFLGETNTGIFVAGGGYTMALLLAIFAVFVLLLIIMSAGCKNAPKQHVIQKNIFAGVFALAVSALLFLDSTHDLVEYVTSSNETQTFIMAGASALAAIAFIFLAVSSFSGKNLFRSAPLIALFTTVWGCIRLVVTFLRYTNIVSNGESMLHIISIIFILLFLFSQAKLLAGVENDKTVKHTFVLGMCAIVGIAVFYIPSLLKDVFNGESFVLLDQLPCATDLLLLLYVFSFLIEMTVRANKIHYVGEEPDEDGLPQYTKRLTEVQKHAETEVKPKAQFFDSLVYDNDGVREDEEKSVSKFTSSTGTVTGTQKNQPSTSSSGSSASQPEFIPKTVQKPEKGSDILTGLDEIDQIISEISKENRN